MPDPFSSMGDSLVSPASNGYAITASANELAFITKGIHCNADGTIVVDFYRGGTGISLVVRAGVYYTYRLAKVTNLGTASLIGLY